MSNLQQIIIIKRTYMINKLKTPSRTNTRSPLSIQAGLQTPKCYFYTNSIYMGIIKNMNRIGTGIILFHDGTCAIVSYNTDSQFHGHSIFYKNRCIISVHYIRNRIVDIAYRIDGFLLYLKYNQQSKINGDCYLINFIERTVELVVYQDGQMRSKQRMSAINKTLVQNILVSEGYHLVVGRIHAQAMRHQITRDDISNVRIKKIGNKAQVHYMPFDANSNQKLAQGLGFQFIYRSPEHGGYNPETNKCGDQFQLKIIQKGIYKDNLLEGYGLRIFKNNNTYEGYFHRNVFHGEGALTNMQKGSWVYGIFANGQLADILDFSNESNEQAKCKILLENLREKQPCFINQMIEENNFDFLDFELEKVSSRGNISQFKAQTFEDRKLQIMRKISAQFMELQAARQLNIQNEMKRMKQSRANLVNYKQKINQNEANQPLITPKHKINSLLPQSLKNNRFIQKEDLQSNKEDLKNLEIGKQIFNMTMKTHRQQQEQSGKKLSKIFRKTYSNIDKQQDDQRVYEGSDFLKLHKVEKSKRQRKSHIFTSRPNYEISQFSLGQSKSPRFHDRSMNQTSSNPPYKRRSPYRKTTIFDSTVKLKRTKQNQINKIDQDIDEQSSLKKLQSIRKGSIDKKTMSSQKNRSKKNINSPIFEEPKQKQKQSIGKFIYKFDSQIKQKQSSDKAENFSGKNSFSSPDQSPLLKSQKLLISKKN